MKNYLYVLSLSCCLFACSQVVDENEMNPKGRSVAPPNVSMNVSQEDALNVACTFHSQQYGGVAGVQSRQLSSQASLISDAKNSPLAYVVNHKGGGWTMVSATKEYYPILAYSETHSFPLEQIINNEGLNLWLDEISQAIQSYQKFDAQTTSQIALEWLKYTPQTLHSVNSGLPSGNSHEAIMCRNRLKELNETYRQDGWSFTTLSSIQQVNIPQRIYDTANQYSTPYEYTIVGIKEIIVQQIEGPFTTTLWSQGDGYNQLCPDNCVAGCVPIAMAQIMKFHRYPSLFNWGDMLDNKPTYASQYLIADIGKNIHVQYGVTESSAKLSDAKMGFQTYGYRVIQKTHNDKEVADELVRSKSPVFMVGKSETGHAWVCDGYTKRSIEYDLYAEYVNNGRYDNLGLSHIDNPDGFGGTTYPASFHMNWGWGGMYNGWFHHAKPAPDMDFSQTRKNLYVSIY